MTTSVEVSVIIPTYNRFHQLLKCLEALARQTFPVDQYEVVVVDDGSTDETSIVKGQSFPFQLTYCYQSNQGSAAARNQGAEKSKGKTLIFLDDDIFVEEGFVSAVTEEQNKAERAIVMGVLCPLTDKQQSVYQSVNWDGLGNHQNQDKYSRVSFTELTSNNTCVKRVDFFSLGMWQDVAGDGQTLWGDVDFAYRAYKQGYVFRRCPTAIAYHDDYANRDLATASRRAEIAAQRAVLLFKRYPELLGYLPMFHDKTPIDWRCDSWHLIARKFLRQIASSCLSLTVLEYTTRLLEGVCPSPRLLRPLYRWIIGGYIFRGYREGLRKYAGKSVARGDSHV